MLAPVGEMLVAQNVLDKLIEDFLTFTDRRTITYEDIPALIWNMGHIFSPALHKEMILILMKDYPLVPDTPTVVS